MDVNKIKKEDLQNMKVWELCKYIRAANPDYKFCGYLPREDALNTAMAIYDELHEVKPARKAISWDKYFMGVAELSAERSKDPKTQVGAVIVDPRTNHIVSIGYNGLPYGTKDTDELWSTDEKHFFVVHAEANAILNATTGYLTGDVIYITQYPCHECAKLLAQKRIAKVVYKDSKYRDKESGAYAAKILDAAKIEVVQYKE